MPQVLYHGTRAANLGSILKHGLRPTCGAIHAGNTCPEDSFHDIAAHVYLTDSLNVAQQYGSDGAVFAVDVAQLDAARLGSYRERLCAMLGVDAFYHYRGRISPDALKQV